MEKPYENKNFLKLCLIASLITINRIDAIILFIPPLCYGFFKNFSTKKIGMGFLGFAPFIVWEIFSFFYYGFLFPNTAYAKLNITTSKLDQVINGIKYIFSSNIYGDNITLIVIVIVVILGIYLIKRKQAKYMTAIIAVVSYVLYIVYIGGDFMVGRFMSGPFFLSILILYDYMSEIDLSDLRDKKLAEKSAVFITVIILFLGCVPQTSTITSPVRYQNYRDYLRDTNPMDRPRDVRSYYYEETGLTYYVMDVLRNGYNPDRVIHEWGRAGQMYDEDEVYVAGGIGFTGYFCPDETIIINSYALVDPLLARIPAPPNQWAAHNQRGVPLGYELTLKTGENAIENEALHEYYDKLHLVVSGPIFNAERLKTAVFFNLGKYDYLMDEYILSPEYRETLTMYGR